MRRALFDDTHEDFRASFRRFLEREVLPSYEEWERDGIVPRELFALLGARGFLGMAVPERHGGAGARDFRFNLIIGEECQYAGVASLGLGISLHNDICLPYFLAYCDEAQRARWLPGIADGTLIAAIAMTEPQTGSDLAGIATRARREDDDYVVNGSKTFVSNGINADLVITAVRTDPDQPHRGLSLVVVERGIDGFTRGRNLDKIGQHAQDTAELSFSDARVPLANRLGEEGAGFAYLMSNLPQERLAMGAAAVAGAEAAIAWTRAYVGERQAFGQPIGSFQHTRFELAEMHSETQIARVFIDHCVEALNDETLTAEDAAIAKWWCTELQGRVTDRCLQLHGGYGYMSEYPIARAWTDARVTRIYGGTNEIMKEIVGRSLGL